MANEYDEIVELQAAEATPYDAAILDYENDLNTTRRSSLLTAQQSNPDQYARAADLSKRTGIPAPVVVRNFDDVQRKAKLNEYDRLLADNPQFAEAVRQYGLLNVAHDDLDNASALHKTARFFSRAGRNLYAGVGARFNEGGFGVLEYLSSSLAATLEPLARNGLLPTNPAAEAAQYFADARQKSAAAAEQLTADNAQASTLERGIYSGFQSLGQNVPLLAGAALTKNPALALGGMSATVGGQEYGRARDQGLSVNDAATYATTQAAIEYVTEKIPVGRLFGDLEKSTGFVKTVLGQIVTEVPGEQIATVAQDLVEWVELPQNADKPFSEYLAERPSAAAETLVATVVAAGGQTGAVRAVDAAARRVSGRVSAGKAAEADAERLQALNKLAAASKLRERAPAQFQSLVENAAPDSDVYIDASVLTDALAQSESNVPDDIAERIGEAQNIDGDVRLSVAEFATHFAGKAGESLIPHVKTSPEAMSFAEAESFAQSGVQNQFEAEAADAVEADAIENERRAGTDSVRRAVLDQLELVERFTPDVNNVYASLASSFYATMASRLGTTPDALYAEMPLTIVAESPLGQAFQADNQRGAFVPGENVIALLKGADLSTLAHESGHFYLEALTDLATREGAPAELGSDLQTVLSWFGIEDAAAWQAMDLEQRRESHEKFARGFESYLIEGKAPSAELQQIFQRFRAWLLNVYKNLRNLNVELTPEVRAVFDRMLATDAQISEAENLRSFEPIFESAEQAGMTPEQFSQYQKLGAQATAEATGNLEKRTLNDLRWLSNAKGRVLKALQKDASTKRKGVRSEVRAEVEQEPVYRARRFLREGEIERDGEVVTVDDHKLSLKSLQEMYPDGGVDFSQLTRGKRGVAKKGGIHPDTLAELLGYSSGDHLVRSLLEAPPINDVIEARTDQVTLERFGDITDAATLEREAEREIANDTRSRFISRELAGLQKAFGLWPTLQRAANNYARESILRKRIRDLRPYQYTVAERKAARTSAQAFKSGDTAGAASAKRSQLLANRLGKVAADVRAEIETSLAYLKRLNTESARKRIGPEYSEQIDSLLERHDLRKAVSNKELARRKSLLQWIEAQRELGFEPEIDEHLLNEAGRKHYRDLTVEEFRGLVDAVRNVEHLGRLKTRLLTAQDQRRFDEAVADAERSIRDNAKTTRKQEIEGNLPLDAAGRLLRGLGAMHRKFASVIRQMDGGKDGGTLWELFVRPLNAAADREATMREQATVELAKLFKGQTGLHRKTYIPAIDTSLTKEGRLAIALNWGNAANRQRILDGDRWTPQQVEAILATLTKDDWDFVQSVWDHIDSYWPQIEAKQKRVTGIVPEKVEASPVQTAHGEYRGGYYPIAYDPQRSTKAEADSLAESVRQTMQGLYTRATTRRGHTKARVESVQRPVRKDLGVIIQHIETVVHDLTHHEFLIDANRLLRAPSIDAAIRDHYSPEILRMLRTTLDDVAKGDIVAQSAFEQAINHLRQGVTIAGLGWNLSTAFLQPLGLTQSIVRIGPKYVGRGVAQWIGGAARMEHVVSDIYDRSEFMRLRGKTMQRELNEIRNRVKGKTSRIESSYFYLIQKLQMVADVPTWLGAYQKATDEGNDDARAVALADQAVVDAQGGGSVKDLAEIQRGGPLLKLWTNFYSYFSTTYNLTAESVGRTTFRKPADVGRLAVDFLMLYSVPAVLGLLLKKAVRGDDWDEDQLAAELAREQLGYLLGAFVGGRELGSAVQGYSYRGPTGTQFFAEASRLWQQAEQGDVDEAFLKAANKTAGILFHYPAGQVERTVAGINAVVDDGAPLSSVLFGPPRD